MQTVISVVYPLNTSRLTSRMLEQSCLRLQMFERCIHLLLIRLFVKKVTISMYDHTIIGIYQIFLMSSFV